MPSAANGDTEKYVSALPVESSPIRRAVEILQCKIAFFEKQKSKLASCRDTKSKDGSAGEKANPKVEEINLMLDFAWDLCKQFLGIAIWSESEAKKIARKESGVRKCQDVGLVQEVLLIQDCLEQMSLQTAREDFLAGSCGTTQISQQDLKALDEVYSEVTPKHDPEDDSTTFQHRSLDAAKHLVAIVEGSSSEVVGTSYAHIKSVVETVHGCGYFDRLREPEPEPEVEEVQPEEVPEEEEVVGPSSSPPPPLPAPQTVPVPAFPMLPPLAPPVTLQQVEHAYFSQQFHQQKQPIAEVFGPQNFFFLQDSEIDTPEVTRQPSPRPISPTPIPSQTFTNQSFAIPSQHFTPELQQNPHLTLVDIPQPAHFPPSINEIANAHIAGYPTANPPPPIPMPPSHGPVPAHMSIPPVQVVSHQLQQPRLPSPSFPPNVFKQNVAHTQDQSVPLPPAPDSPNIQPQEEPLHSSPVEQQIEWNDNNHSTEQLEINEWNPSTEYSSDTPQADNQAAGKYRPRGRGRGNSQSNYRSRGGGYQNGRSGSYYRNNDSYHNNSGNAVNGGNFPDNYRDGNRYDNSQSGYQGGYKGRNGTGGGQRGGGPRGERGAPRGPPRASQPRPAPASRSQYPRKSSNQFESRPSADAKQFAH